MFHIHPITYAARQVVPFVRIAHHHLAAIVVIVLDRYFFAYVLLGYPQFFLHSQFHRQPVRVPSGFSLHAVALQRLVAAENILYRACHNVVDTRHTVCRRRAFEKYERTRAVPLRNAFGKYPVIFPIAKLLLRQTGKVQSFILVETLLVHTSVVRRDKSSFKTCENTNNFSVFMPKTPLFMSPRKH